MTLPLIMVAPNGAFKRKSDHPAVPETVAELVETAVACAKAGADGIHAHVRDADGQHVLDAGLYREFLTELEAALPGFYAQITTEAIGKFTPEEQRRVVREVQPKAVSVALREMMSGDRAAARAFYHESAEAGIEVQHILYDALEVDRLADLIEDGVIPDRGLSLLHVLGRYRPGHETVPQDLQAPLLRQRDRALDADWATCAFGPTETDCLTLSVLSGGKARIGFENNLYHSDGTLARDNAERVAQLRLALTAVAAHLQFGPDNQIGPQGRRV